MHFKVKILFFGGLKDQVGRESMELEIDAQTKIQYLMAQLHLEGPVLCAVNQVQVSSDTTFHEGDEIALMPPMSGG
jgi:molybdopterin converting factor small subunit